MLSKKTKEFRESYNSISPLLGAGGRWILVVNQPLARYFVPEEGTSIIEGKDKWFVNSALNLGLDEVNTDYRSCLLSLPRDKS